MYILKQLKSKKNKIMKNLLIFLSIFLVSFSSLKAQDSEQKINIFLGIGGSIQGAKIKTPAFYGSYEYFISDNLSIGALAGYSTLSVTNINFSQGGTEEDNTSNIVFGGLANYYLLRNDDFETYFGLSLGYGSGLTASLFYEFHGGARYQINESISINSELGFGLSLLKVGVSFDL